MVLGNKALIIPRGTAERSNGYEKCVERCFGAYLSEWEEAIKQFNYYMTEEERLEQLGNLNEKGSQFLTAKNNRDPSIANYAFFDRSLNWLCHRIDKKTADHVWCAYYWDCMALIASEKKNDSQAERFD